MKGMVISATLIAGALLVTAGCESSGTGFDVAAARDSESIEMQIDQKGRLSEVEYHVAPKSVPQPVQDAMSRLHPSARITGAEREISDGVLYWELSGDIEGREVEAMFLPDGTLHQEEIQVPMNTVPGPVRETVRREWPDAVIRAWEEIRDGKRNVLEYHVKLERNGRRYKLMIAPDGRLGTVVREVPAEVEVPVR